jgi:flagellin
MIINHNLSAMYICRNLNFIQNAQAKCMMRLSTGRRINSAADDPAGFCISEKMESQIRGLNMATRNTEDAISLVQTADGHLNEVHSILQRMRELTVQAATDTNGSSERTAIEAEMDQLNKEIKRICGTSDFNEKKLFDGSSSTLKIQVGPNSGDTLDLEMDNVGSNLSGLSGVDVSSNTAANKSLKLIDDAISSVSGTRGKLGAYQNRLERIVDLNENTSENLEAAYSRIVDADMAKEMMEYARLNVLGQVSMALLAQSNQQPMNILKLLQSMT